jgi:hypothetical protein
MSQKKVRKFPTIIDQLEQSVEALRDFSSVVEPVLRRRVSIRVKKDVRALLPILGPLIGKDGSPPTDKEFEQNLKRIRRIYKGKIVFKKAKIDGELALKTNFKDKKLEQEVFLAMKGFSKAVERSELLRRNSLVSLLSAAEWAFSESIYAYLREHPQLVTQNSEKVFTYREILSFGSVEDIAEQLIQTRIRKLTNDNIVGWIHFLDNQLKIDLEMFDEELIKILKEIFARRNLIVHNGSQASQSYVKKFKDLIAPKTKAGTGLRVDANYFDRSAEIVETFFIVVCSSIWRLTKQDESQERFVLLLNLAASKLEKKQYFSAEKICQYLLEYEELEAIDRSYATINYWQSYKWSGRFDKIRKSIEEADFSAHDDLLRLARLVLLEKNDDFFVLLPQVLRSKKLKEKQLMEWPLFQKIRRTRKFKSKYSRS